MKEEHPGRNTVSGMPGGKISALMIHILLQLWFSWSLFLKSNLNVCEHGDLHALVGMHLGLLSLTDIGSRM